MVSSEGRTGIPVFIIFHWVMKSGKCRDEENKGIEEKLKSFERFVLLLQKFSYFLSFLEMGLIRELGLPFFLQIEGYLFVKMQKQRRKWLKL